MRRPSPTAGSPAPAPSSDGIYFCHSLRSATSSGSLCFSTFERCERERQSAEADGLTSDGCGQRSPVACFQLGGDDNPSNEVCAASTEDCEVWRRIDEQKNGAQAAPCSFKH